MDTNKTNDCNDHALISIAQICEILRVAEAANLPEAIALIKTLHDAYLGRIEQSRNQQATLFRIKQLEVLLTSGHIDRGDRALLLKEKADILESIAMPESISIVDFASESRVNSDAIDCLREGIRSGRLVAS